MRSQQIHISNAEMSWAQNGNRVHHARVRRPIRLPDESSQVFIASLEVRDIEFGAAFQG
jgi:hypothetical protein